MSNTASTTTSKKKKFIRAGILLAVASLVFFALWHGGYVKWPNVVPHAEARADADRLNEFDDDAAASEVPNWEERAEKLQRARINLAHKGELIHNYHLRCGESSYDNLTDKRIEVMNLAGCQVGKAIPLTLFDPYGVEKYNVVPYTYANGDPTTPLEELAKHKLTFNPLVVPEVVSKHPGNPRHVASCDDRECQLGGEVEYIYRGDADVLALVRK